jgi:Fur family ferric uptake transcriptional regulator
MIQVETLLKKSGLRKTDARIKVLEYLLEQNAAISQPELEKNVNDVGDRVTLYRILHSFEENGIVHKVLDSSGTFRYALCVNDSCRNESHQHEHIHFDCEVCGTVKCLENVLLPQIQLPQNYKVSEIQLIVKGVCSNCSK